MDIIEDIFQSMHIFRAWMLCGTDDDAMDAAAWLQNHDHTVTCITSEDIEDERMRYKMKLAHFRDTARMLVISYPVWHQIQDEIEVNVLPLQNLMLMWRIDEESIPYIQRCLKDAAMRGFVSNYENAIVVPIPEENVF